MTLLAFLTPALLAWEAFVALSLFGFGLGFLRLLRRRSLPLGLALCAGVAVWLLFGGVLNLLQLATKPVLWSLLTAGFVVLLLELRDATLRQRLRAGVRRIWPRAWAARAVAAVLIAWFGLALVGHLGTFTWNKFDDLQGYTAFAEKASALGGLQPEPFSERRITSGVGGTLFLDATMLAGAGDVAMDFMEGVYGPAALLLLLGALTRHFRLNTARTLAVFTAAAFFTFGRANISSVNLSAAIFLALLLLQLQPVYDYFSVLLTGMLLGAVFTLKSSNIPFCCLFLLFSAGAQAYRQRTLRAPLALVFSGLAALLFVLPWAIKHRLDEATALFPTLGRGDHISAYGFPTIGQTVPTLISVGASSLDLLPPLVAALFAGLLLRKERSRATAPLLSFLLAAAVAAPLFSIAVGAADLDRFLLPVLNTCALLFLCILLSAPAGWLRPWALLFFTGWLFGFYRLAVKESFFRDPGDLALFSGNHNLLQWYESVRTPADTAAYREQLRRVQNVIPPGASVLEEVQDAYAFDFRRNPVLFADYPGMASPPPGLPMDGDAVQIRAFLLAHNVHYVIFDRSIDRTHVLHGDQEYREFRRAPQVHPSWNAVLRGRHVDGYSRIEHLVSARTQQFFYDLATPSRVLDRDGTLTLLDLDKD